MATKKKASKAVAAKKAAAKPVAAKKMINAKSAPKQKAMAPAKPARKRKAVEKAQVISTANKASALSKIADLQAQVDDLKRDAVAELKEKLAEARKVVRGLDNELKRLGATSTRSFR